MEDTNENVQCILIILNGEKNLNDLNILKLILNTDENEIYRYYPSRKGNVLCKNY
jgi:hypothetical protein